MLTKACMKLVRDEIMVEVENILEGGLADWYDSATALAGMRLSQITEDVLKSHSEFVEHVVHSRMDMYYDQLDELVDEDLRDVRRCIKHMRSVEKFLAV